jgi:hypothetical protein
LGFVRTDELIPNGKNIEVTDDNKLNYVKKVANYIMVEQINP